jgi:hypothetical protein
VALTGLREDVTFASSGFQLSERTACKLLGVDRVIVPMLVHPCLMDNALDQIIANNPNLYKMILLYRSQYDLPLLKKDLAADHLIDIGQAKPRNRKGHRASWQINRTAQHCEARG